MFKVKQDFNHIAQLNFSHQYTGQGAFDRCVLTPSAEALNALTNLKILIKPFKGGLNILSENPDLLKGESAPILLRLMVTDPLFFSYTDFGMEVRPNSSVFCFPIPKKSTDSQDIQGQDYVSSADLVLPLNQKSFAQINAKNLGGENQIIDHTGYEIRSANLVRYFFQTGEALLTINERNTETQYYKSNSNLEKLPFGIIPVYLDALYSEFVKTGGPVQFFIRFKTRKTYWRYILSDKIFEKFPILRVVDVPDRRVNFKEEEFEIQADWKVRSFVSIDPIPYLLDGSIQFQLIDKTSESRQAAKVIYKQLPAAKPDQLHFSPAKPDLAYSHIFI
jgi:hypothetical protein